MCLSTWILLMTIHISLPTPTPQKMKLAFQYLNLRYVSICKIYQIQRERFPYRSVPNMVRCPYTTCIVPYMVLCFFCLYLCLFLYFYHIQNFHRLASSAEEKYIFESTFVYFSWVDAMSLKLQVLMRIINLIVYLSWHD